MTDRNETRSGASDRPMDAPVVADREVGARRRPYVAPRIERRVPIVSNTLLSGGQCVLPGDPCD